MHKSPSKRIINTEIIDRIIEKMNIDSINWGEFMAEVLASKLSLNIKIFFL